MENNNIFKYATKELSQDAFICYCINYINYPNSSLYKLGIDMLEQILYPNIENDSLYPYYTKGEIFEKINQGLEKEKKYNIKDIPIKEVEDIYNDLNSRVDKIKLDVGKKINELRNKLDVNNISHIKITRQFKNMDIVITVNNEYVVIIEDKVDATTNEQLQRYIETMKDVINNNDDLELLELDVSKFSNSKVIPVYMKTGYELYKEKVIPFRRINGKVILKVLKKYKNENEVITAFYNNLSDKLDVEDVYKYKRIIEKHIIEVGEKFSKRYTIYNCFSKCFKIPYIANEYFDNNYISNIHLTQQYCTRLPNEFKNLYIWTPKLIKFNGWKNTLLSDKKVIVEEKVKKDEDYKLNIEEIRYVFARKRDIFNKEYFEFLGLYKLDLEKSTNNKRFWNKIDIDKVALPIVSENKSNVEKVDSI